MELNYFKKMTADLERDGPLVMVFRDAMWGAADRELLKALLNLLVEKNVLTLEEARRVKDEAFDNAVRMFQEWKEEP